ncbi:bifunctional sulfate adenylyltransferase/adenylylsulfate kinase [Candidatus Acetothermia bacterium]|nr:bifunctional sulfate adenylyltransferase/adenylylsulfate kinase [Candidatus Acetothermia bacterium]MBI3643988.1 bifunctional sulfate adenylyltransferase/adenylylsulfate kinase [Candidatus Acetothermia bacterium]
MVTWANVSELKEEALTLISWDLNQRQIWDLELLLNGAFAPLTGFLPEIDYRSVCQEMRLGDGTLWPIPINLDVTEEFAGKISCGDRMVLRHPEGMALAILEISDIWKPDLHGEAQAVFRTTDVAHPGVASLLHQMHPVYVGGHLEGIELPPHHTFNHLRHTPLELLEQFNRRGWKKIVAFQTRNPMHRAHIELTRRASEELKADLLLHPVVGRTSPGDIDYFVRVRCYEAILKHYPQESTMLSLLPLAMRMAGPREALWHAIIRKNYGCTHFIIGRDHAGPGLGSDGKPFYGPYEAQELAKSHENELGIMIKAFEEMVCLEDSKRYVAVSEVSQGAKVLSLSGTELRKRLRDGTEIPEWFSYPDVIQELRKVHPPRQSQGFTIFFTGLSGAGKSTIAQTVMAKLMEIGTRPVTLLDGDIVRKHLSSELGFSKRDRDINIRRIGYVASEITKNRGIAICAPIAPYEVTRTEVREMISPYGAFIEIYVSTPIEVCEERDRKGLYAKARAGLIKEFTGIDDPYEVPRNPEMGIDTSQMSADAAANSILEYLSSQGFIQAERSEKKT